jgi:hypothetical protein
MVKVLYYIVLFFGLFFLSCRNDKGINPNLAFSDKSFYDTIKNTTFYYYKNQDVEYSGNSGPHGIFKLSFNNIAKQALTDNDKLPIGSKFPDGSLVLKDIKSPAWYAFMYKKSGSWLWGEISKTGDVIFSVNTEPNLCVNCHNQSGNRDLVVSFNFY